MKRILVLLVTTTLMFSCAKEDNLHITGTIKGLRKGELFLQKVENSKLVNIDSLEIKGDPAFSFSTNLEEPEVLYLYLVKDDGIDINDRLEFFAEPGNITINTTSDYFLTEAKVEGSKTNDKLLEYRKMMSKFADKNLEYIKSNLEYAKAGDSVKADSILKVSEQNKTRGYLFTLNFALNNKDSYVSPYIALSEAYNVNLKYLDTINNSLSPEVAHSKYGKALNDYIQKLKNGEPENPENSENKESKDQQ